MWQSIPSYRVTCLGKPAGPWRLRLTAARHDAISDGLGCYDEWGSYFDIVPGAIECREVQPQLLGLTDDQVTAMVTSERRARLSVRQRQMACRQERSPDVRRSTNKAPTALGRT